MFATAAEIGTKPNRVAHIRSADDWRESVMVSFYAKKTAILAAVDKAGVDAVTWDWPADFDASEPGVTIESATAITD